MLTKLEKLKNLIKKLGGDTTGVHTIAEAYDRLCECHMDTAGGVSSWNDLTDKPFGETVTYSDTVYANKNTGLYYQESQYSSYLHITDEAPSYDDIVKGCWGMQSWGTEVDYTTGYRITPIADGKATMLDTHVYIIHEDGIEFDGYTWKKGVWFCCGESIDEPQIVSLRFAEYQFSNVEIKTLDPKFVPGAGMVVKMTEDTSDASNIHYVTDKTFDEIAEAIESGCNVTLAYVMPSGIANYFKLAIYMPDQVIAFDAIAIQDEMGFYTSYAITPDGTVQENGIGFTVTIPK